eukprot:1734404-Lingulodinium_polyedra.AAC.1
MPFARTGVDTTRVMKSRNNARDARKMRLARMGGWALQTRAWKTHWTRCVAENPFDSTRFYYIDI